MHVLVLTTDLPFFPGRLGDDYFKLRYLGSRHEVGLVSVCFDSYPREGVANLEQALASTYLWPRPSPAVPLPVTHEFPEGEAGWLRALPSALRQRLLRRLLRIAAAPRQALDQLVTLAHCAPQLLHALRDRRWGVFVLIQSSLEPWLDYLPASAAKLVYFHDVRAEYLRRVDASAGGPVGGELAAIRRQEQRVIDGTDVAAFVSELDLERARSLYRMGAECGVAPIPIDRAYFHPAPAGWPADPRPMVLFTGHLSHPPNVDAVVDFIANTWPLIRAAVPEAIFQVAGRSAHPRVRAAVSAGGACELHEDVPDIRPFFWNARAYVVPMRFGGGVRQKIFEAWSMHVPVVCTPMAAEGTQAADGASCWMASDPSTFAARVVDLLLRRVEPLPVLATADRLASGQSVEETAPRFEQLVARAPSVRRQRPFKVLYDLRWMETGRAGGIEQATYELIDTIGLLDRRNQYRLLAPRSACWDWNFPDSFQVSRHVSDSHEQLIESHRSHFVNRLARSVGSFPVLTRQMRSLAAYRALDFDLVHSLASYTSLDMRPFPAVVTVSDLQHLQFPQFFGKEEWEERERLYRSSVEAAARVICISEYTRQEVHRRYGVPLDKLVTIWNIPGRSVWRPLGAEVRARLLANMGLHGRFLFFPAHGWPHKNHARLVEAFARALPELPRDILLVMTGRPFPAGHAVPAFIADRGLDSRIRHIGYRSPLEVLALYQECHALVFPSLFEGFGMPVAEAIIAGRPVACSNITSLPEIAGDAAVMFDPEDVDQIARSLVEVSTDEGLRAALIEAARVRRPLFSARRSAARTIAVYGEVFSGAATTESP